MSLGLVACPGGVSPVTGFHGLCSSAPREHLPALCRMLALTVVLSLEPWWEGMALCSSPLSWVSTWGSPEALPQGGGDGSSQLPKRAAAILPESRRS